MSTAAPDRLMTIAEFHALPEDDTVERELIRGMLWEEPMTRRNKWHTQVEARISQLLGDWLDTQPEPRGRGLQRRDRLRSAGGQHICRHRRGLLLGGRRGCST